MKVMFRMYPDGEVMGLLPTEAGDPEGKLAAGYINAGGFYSCDPEKVVANTKAAPKGKYTRLLRKMEQELEEPLEVISKIPADADQLRKENPVEDHQRFKRIARVYAIPRG